VYTRGFLKEVMRVSMARNYEDFGSKLCVLEGDGKEELIDLLQRLKALGFKLLLLENREVFQDPRLVGCTAESIFQHPLMEDLGAPLAFIFGGEVGQLLPEVLLYCDAGAFIPSSVGEGEEPLLRLPERSFFWGMSHAIYIYMYIAHICSICCV
ncbi:unnamed protein product, partial [Durusdinium trenchii]